MSLGSWNGLSSSSALVDSALPGSQDDASLSWTSVSFWANPPEMPRITTQATRTIHLVTREVSLPAIWWCMRSLHHRAGTEGIGVFPEMPAGETRRGGRTHRWDATRPNLVHKSQGLLISSRC